MISIRRNIFETNSSSTHSLTMCSESEYDKWKNGELLYHIYHEKFKTKEQILEDAKNSREEYLEKQKNGETLYCYQEEYARAETNEDLLKIELDNKYWKTFDSFWDYVECEYETFEREYTASNGEKIIAFGYYGYDG